MNPADLPQKIVEIEARQQWLENVLATCGVTGPWCSPNEASKLLGVSRDRIMDEIRDAENARATRKKSDLCYGIHYRNVQQATGDRPTWQICIPKFAEIMAIPPDERLFT